MNLSDRLTSVDYSLFRLEEKIQNLNKKLEEPPAPTQSSFDIEAVAGYPLELAGRLTSAQQRAVSTGNPPKWNDSMGVCKIGGINMPPEYCGKKEADVGKKKKAVLEEVAPTKKNVLDNSLDGIKEALKEAQAIFGKALGSVKSNLTKGISVLSQKYQDIKDELGDKLEPFVAAYQATNKKIMDFFQKNTVPVFSQKLKGAKQGVYDFAGKTSGRDAEDIKREVEKEIQKITSMITGSKPEPEEVKKTGGNLLQKMEGFIRDIPEKPQNAVILAAGIVGVAALGAGAMAFAPEVLAAIGSKAVIGVAEKGGAAALEKGGVAALEKGGVAALEKEGVAAVETITEQATKESAKIEKSLLNKITNIFKGKTPPKVANLTEDINVATTEIASNEIAAGSTENFMSMAREVMSKIPKGGATTATLKKEGAGIAERVTGRIENSLASLRRGSLTAQSIKTEVGTALRASKQNMGELFAQLASKPQKALGGLTRKLKNLHKTISEDVKQFIKTKTPIKENPLKGLNLKKPNLEEMRSKTSNFIRGKVEAVKKPFKAEGSIGKAANSLKESRVGKVAKKGKDFASEKAGQVGEFASAKKGQAGEFIENKLRPGGKISRGLAKGKKLLKGAAHFMGVMVLMDAASVVLHEGPVAAFKALMAGTSSAVQGGAAIAMAKADGVLQATLRMVKGETAAKLGYSPKAKTELKKRLDDIYANDSTENMIDAIGKVAEEHNANPLLLQSDYYADVLKKEGINIKKRGKNDAHKAMVKLIKKIEKSPETTAKIRDALEKTKSLTPRSTLEALGKAVQGGEKLSTKELAKNAIEQGMKQGYDPGAIIYQLMSLGISVPESIIAEFTEVAAKTVSASAQLVTRTEKTFLDRDLMSSKIRELEKKEMSFQEARDPSRERLSLKIAEIEQQMDYSFI